MKFIDDQLLSALASRLDPEDRDEMAIPSYLHRNPLLRWMARRRLQVLADWYQQLAVAKARRLQVMDFGCGTGILFPTLLEHAEKLVGVDIVLDAATYVIEQLGLSERVELISADGVGEQIEPESLDMIVAGEVLEHVDNVAETSQLFHRLLGKDGSLLVSLPTENALYSFGRRLAGFHGHYHHSNAATIHPIILDNGFALERIARVPLPGPFAIYWVASYRRV